ncbi:DUF6541 family protein [Thermococcus sp.]|uniref:DUF6541 family protein n=2 Tax=Thermococcus sp. TaxID=35749 RepID=UPI0025D1365E|nr:DUF6541 family protein [Thermococcus sp.]
MMRITMDKILKLMSWSLLTIVVIFLANYLNNPYLGFFIPFILGFNLLIFLTKSRIPFSMLFTLSPALGLSVLVIGAYVSSDFNIPLHTYYWGYTLFVALTSLLLGAKIHSKLSLDFKETFTILLSALLLVTVHYFAYTYPTDNVDNYFHATKILYMLKSDSMFPMDAPSFSVVYYPGGYHSLAGYLVKITSSSIPSVMLAIRTLAWLLFVFGVYFFARIWFDSKIAMYSIIAIISTNIVHYYLLVYVEPNFIGFYFFLVMLTLTFSYINDNELRRGIIFYKILGVIIGTASIFFHPYSFQNYVLVITVYIVLKTGLKTSKLLQRSVGETIFVYLIIPLLFYAVLNPYFTEILVRGIEAKGAYFFNVSTSHDNWTFFKFMWKWATIRNNNYAEVLFIILGFTYYLLKKSSKKPEILSIYIFILFVVLLNIDKLTLNMPIPFYSAAAMERQFLWTVPLFPVLVGTGMGSLSLLLNYFRSSLKNKLVRGISVFIYTLIIASFFLIPAYGTARDIVSAEANFYVTPDVIEDFNWISTHYSSTSILGSCHSDSSPWLPFFEGTNYTLLSEPYFRKCHIGSKTIERFVEEVLSKNKTLPNTLAFIDTNAPSLNPLEFAKRYSLLRINGNDWIFDLSSHNLSKNEKVILDNLRLCSSTLPGDVYKFGKYYVWGFTKKYFYVEYFAFNGLYVAWLSGKTGIIAFNPCKNYDKIYLTLFASTKMEINVSINGKRVLTQELNRGLNVVKISAIIQKNSLNTIEITKSLGVLMVYRIKMG